MANAAFKAGLARALGLDLRSLGLFRLGLALVVLYDALARWSHLNEHYTYLGVLPLSQHLLSPQVGPSLHLGSDTPALVASLFALQALAALSLLLGWRPRQSTFLCLVLVLSAQYRNPLVIDGGDVLLRALLVWGLFLPWGEAFGLEAGERPDRSVLNVGTLALSLQLCQLYWYAFLYKSGPAWWQEGSAVTLALGLSEFATSTGLWLREQDLSAGLTRMVMLTEACAPFFLLCPGGWRWLALVPLGGLQVGIILTLAIGPFNPIALIALLAFLPPQFWNRLVGLQNALQRVFDRLRARQASFLAAPSPPAPAWWNVLGGLLLVLVVGCNLLSWGKGRAAVPEWLDMVRIWTGLHQEWSMFSPEPPRRDVWLVVGLETDKGTLDPRTGGELRLGPPDPLLPRLLDARQRKCLSSLTNPGMDGYQRLYLQAVMRDWNRRHPDQTAHKATLHRLSRDNLTRGQPESEIAVTVP